MRRMTSPWLDLGTTLRSIGGMWFGLMSFALFGESEFALGFSALGMSILFFWMASRSRKAALAREDGRIDREQVELRRQLKEELRGELLEELRRSS